MPSNRCVHVFSVDILRRTVTHCDQRVSWRRRTVHICQRASTSPCRNIQADPRHHSVDQWVASTIIDLHRTCRKSNLRQWRRRTTGSTAGWCWPWWMGDPRAAVVRLRCSLGYWVVWLTVMSSDSNLTMWVIDDVKVNVDWCPSE